MRRAICLLSCLLLPAATGAASCSSDEHHDDGPGALSDQEYAAAFEQAFTERDLKGDSARCSGVVVPDQSGFDGRVALTFDDGPNPETTTQILATLRAHDVPATFFINGKRVVDDRTRAIVKEIVDDPLFLLANHTWAHPQMTRLSSGDAQAQIDRTTEVIDEAGGQAKWFRFPFGASNCTTAEQVTDRGYTVTGWHIDSADWCYARGGRCAASTFQYVDDELRDDMQGWVMKQVPRLNGGILLFHDIHKNTADSLDGIIKALQDGGYSFTNIDDVDTFPALNGIIPPFVGSPCAADADCTWSEEGFCHVAGVCTQSCEGYCPDHASHPATFCTGNPADAGATGICVSKSDGDEAVCAAQEGTSNASANRFQGGSRAPEAEAEVCMPRSEG